MGCRYFATIAHNSAKSGRINNAVDLREHRRKLNCQFLASLAATCSEDRATRTGAHTQTEAVHLGATTVVGLESTLRHCVLLGQWPDSLGERFLPMGNLITVGEILVFVKPKRLIIHKFSAED
jgi:hypothetical protein